MENISIRARLWFRKKIVEENEVAIREIIGPLRSDNSRDFALNNVSDTQKFYMLDTQHT